jgi:hypothetical protein
MKSRLTLHINLSNHPSSRQVGHDLPAKDGAPAGFGFLPIHIILLTLTFRQLFVLLGTLGCIYYVLGLLFDPVGVTLHLIRLLLDLFSFSFRVLS